METRMDLSIFGLAAAKVGEAFCHSSMEDWMNVSTLGSGSSKVWRSILPFINGGLDECLSLLSGPNI
jgi:hypothetical protein